MDRMLLTILFCFWLVGKKMIFLVNATGMIFMILACIGSIGCGLSLTSRIDVMPMMIGRMKKGSGAVRSWIQPSHGAPRISTAASNTQYNAMNTGIWIRIGKQPPSGLIFSVLYISAIA